MTFLLPLQSKKSAGILGSQVLQGQMGKERLIHFTFIFYHELLKQMTLKMDISIEI